MKRGLRAPNPSLVDVDIDCSSSVRGEDFVPQFINREAWRYDMGRGSRRGGQIQGLDFWRKGEEMLAKRAEELLTMHCRTSQPNQASKLNTLENAYWNIM